MCCCNERHEAQESNCISTRRRVKKTVKEGIETEEKYISKLAITERAKATEQKSSVVTETVKVTETEELTYIVKVIAIVEKWKTTKRHKLV